MRLSPEGPSDPIFAWRRYSSQNDGYNRELKDCRYLMFGFRTEELGWTTSSRTGANKLSGAVHCRTSTGLACARHWGTRSTRCFTRYMPCWQHDDPYQMVQNAVDSLLLGPHDWKTGGRLREAPNGMPHQGNESEHALNILEGTRPEATTLESAPDQSGLLLAWLRTSERSCTSFDSQRRVPRCAGRRELNSVLRQLEASEAPAKSTNEARHITAIVRNSTT